MYKIEVFRTGLHTDSAGNSQQWSETDLDKIAGLYNSQYPEHEAPLVLGHPKTDDPAFGWVQKLQRIGQKLYAFVDGVSDKIRDLVNGGAYKKVSIALYGDGLLRHVGLLGAAAPAVKGLAPLQFSNEKEYREFEMDEKKEDVKTDDKKDDARVQQQFAETSEKLKLMDDQLKLFAETNKVLAADNLALKQKIAGMEFDSFVDGLILEGKVLPAEKDALKDEFSDLISLSQGKTFSDEATTPVAKFKDRLSKRPVLIAPPSGKQFASADKAATLEKPGDKLKQGTDKLLKENPGMTFADALSKVSAEQREESLVYLDMG